MKKNNSRRRPDVLQECAGREDRVNKPELISDAFITCDEDKRWCIQLHVWTGLMQSRGTRSVSSFSSPAAHTHNPRFRRHALMPPEELSVSRLVDPVRVRFSQENLQGYHTSSLATCPANKNSSLYLHTQAPESLKPSKGIAEDTSLINGEHMTKELQLALPLLLQRIYFPSRFFFPSKIPPCFRQSHSQFPLALDGRSTSCRKIPLECISSVRRVGMGVRGAARDVEWSSPSLNRSLSFPPRLPLLTGAQTRGCLETQPISPWQLERQWDNVARLSLSLPFIQCKHTASFSKRYKCANYYI